jgi:hypothetical protein
MRKLLVVIVVVGLSLGLTGPIGVAQAQPPEWPGVIGPTDFDINAGQCPEGTTDLEAQTHVIVFWEDAPQVPVNIEATLSVDGGAPVDVTSAFTPNPIEPLSPESHDTSNASTFVPGTSTRTEWTMTVTPEGYAPVTVTDLNESRNPAGFCAHRYECHPSYEGVCVPNDGQIVHCAGTDGEGHAVEGPITVVGPDLFTLDADGDGIACEPALVEAETAPAPLVTARPVFTG